MKEYSKNLLTVLGPTATGKTRLAALVANELDGEIISADSRQVYRGMDLGTGKDYDDYRVEDRFVPYHLVDIVEAGTEYNVFRFQQDCFKVLEDVISRNKFPVLCGGTGMYIESVLENYHLKDTPVNDELRVDLNNYTIEQLVEQLSTYRELHNTTDTNDRNRLVRAIEIEQYKLDNPHAINNNIDLLANVLVGIHFEREVIRARITSRLDNRLKNGMIEEVEALLDNGLTPAQLKFYGLEYRYITMYLTNEITYKTMFEKLNIAIHQFAKRQMTWFRRMENKGYQIHWIDGNLEDTVKVSMVLELLK